MNTFHITPALASVLPDHLKLKIIQDVVRFINYTPTAHVSVRGIEVDGEILVIVSGAFESSKPDELWQYLPATSYLLGPVQQNKRIVSVIND